MTHRPSGLLAGALSVLLLLVLAAPAAATPVSVRVAGDTVGIDTTPVDTTADPVGPLACPGHSAGGALDKAVAGNWDRLAFTQTILGETHDYTNNDYWNLWVNDMYSQVGLCEYIVAPGDRIIMLVQRDTPEFKPTVFPLTLSGVPGSVVAGQPFTVTVTEQRTDAMTTMPGPAAGATVTAGGASAQTDASGQATLTLLTPGPASLRATRAGNVSSEAAALVVTQPAVAPPPPPASALLDRQAPSTSIRGIAEGRRFARGMGPRRLRARVEPDPSGLHAVKLRLTRSDRARCTYFSGKFERFRLNFKNRCSASAGFWFAVETSADVDYLLPRRLPRGRYVLDVNAIDGAFNRDDARRRGGNRIVFYVG